MTVTLPNHVSMATSRPIAGPNGHGWTENIDPPAARHGGTLCTKPIGRGAVGGGTHVRVHGPIHFGRSHGGTDL